MGIEAKVGCCQEQADGPFEVYIPCNRPAVKLVYHERDKRAYRMCEQHAWHNIENRGGIDKGPI